MSPATSPSTGHRSAREPWAQPEEAVVPEAPAFRVVRGTPSAEELAALTAVLAAAASSAQEPEPAPATRTDVLRRAARLRNRIMAVPGAWRMRGR
ncbi:MAG: acyl-CoA carboxylase epsilon subunit [Galactobacter sp.]|uniref:acyl-CoA carboxylase epsilon subunit n=1 Tax=Galactobacter sp. TaxID=2676125 RepID=UPI0025BB784F|nr:acyl-CoA carboxylase epsilon subunit [Galactobacter sp.]